jgi:hypothetical protein
MSDQKKRKTWSDIKTRLETLDRKGLVSLIGDLYDASVANRRFLQTRLAPDARAIEDYRRLVVAAIYPDPFSNRRVSVRDAAAAIIEYKRSTGDAAGTVDLMLTFVEAGTEQAADLGYGDESYFNALETRLDAVAKEFDALPADVREKVRARLRARLRFRVVARQSQRDPNLLAQESKQCHLIRTDPSMPSLKHRSHLGDERLPFTLTWARGVDEHLDGVERHLGDGGAVDGSNRNG